MSEANKQKINANVVFIGKTFMIVHENKDTKNVIFRFNDAGDAQATIDAMKKHINENNINVLNASSYVFFDESQENSKPINESKEFFEDESLLEMEMFNVKRRDIMSLKEFMKTTENASKLIAGKGDISKNKKGYLKEFTRKITRDKLFMHPIYDSTYMAIDISQGKKVEVPYLEPIPYGAHGAPAKSKAKPKSKSNK